MFTKTFSIMLSGILLSAFFGFQTVSAKAWDGAQGAAAEARAKVSKVGVGSKARVEVKLRDDSKLKGYVTASGEDSFTVTDSKTGASQTVAYSDVASVKKSGGLSTRTKLFIGAAAAAGAVITWVIIKPALCDGGAQTRGIC